MADPSVCCVCLVADRDEMLYRSIMSWRGQTAHCGLLIYDSGDKKAKLPVFDQTGWLYIQEESYGRSIGKLRNAANALAEADIIVHFDSDDLSHPNRIAEQVSYLQGSGAECVGYFDGLFWDSRGANRFCTHAGVVSVDECPYCVRAKAYIFRHSHMRYVLGASMCYWRSAWERRPFPDVNIAEDTGWMFDAQGGLAINTWGCSSFAHGDPRIIHEIHGANTNPYDNMDNKFWSRTPEWDDYCRRTLNDGVKGGRQDFTAASGDSSIR